MNLGLDHRRLVTDFGHFAEVILGLKLWNAQRKAAASEKFITAIAAPRRTGKSTLVVAYAIWTCFRDPGARVALISAAESSARDRVEEAQLLLARATEVTGRSTIEEAKTKITFANSAI